MTKNYKLRTRFAALVACFMMTTIALAQVPLVRSTFTGAYTAITTGGGALISTATGDDAVQTGIPIGFTFNYLGTPYTSLGANTNGALGFVGMTNTRFNTDLATATAPNSMMGAWWDDMSVDASSQILYQTQGLAGSQTFTVQWTNVLGYYTGATQRLNFQVILYEGTDVIEFKYGAVVPGTTNTAESGSIGLKNATGGVGNYIDAVTGSSYTSTNMMVSVSKWPVRHIRFTPGVTTPIVGGTYNVGAGQVYPTLDEAVADVNHRGVSGAVVLSLTDANYNATALGGNNIFPLIFGPVAGTSAANTITLQSASGLATIASDGVISGNVTSQASATAIGTTTEPILGIVGGDYIRVNNINFACSATGAVDRGILLVNNTALDGATNNIFENIGVTLNRATTSSVGIQQNTVTTPTNATGANSMNTYRNLVIRNVYAGIQFTGNAAFPDMGTQLTTTSCAVYNVIGDPSVSMDIGGGTSATQTFGIRATNQSGFLIRNNKVRNVSATTPTNIDGILIETFQGTSELSHNFVQTIVRNSTTSTLTTTGLRMTHTTTGTHELRVYDNMISEVRSAYTGAATATRGIRAMFISGSGGATTQTYNIYNNNVSVDGSASLNLSSSCFEHSTTTGPVYNVANNIFANYTATQTGAARHTVMFSTSATVFGNTGSMSNNNDLYVANDGGVSGFVGIGNATTYPTLANWQAAMLVDAASISIDPLYTNIVSDLHATASGLNNAGMAPPAYITDDIDCAARTDNDLGANTITLCAGTPTAGSITGANAVCAGLGTTLTLSGATAGAGITYQWASSTTMGGPYTTMLGTSLTQATGAIPVTTYYVVTVTCTASGMAVTTAEKTVTVNALPVVGVTPGTGMICAPGGSPITLTASGASTYTWLPTAGLTPATGSPVSANPATTTTYTVTGTDGNGCIGTATAAITVAPAVTGILVSALPTAVCIGGTTDLSSSAAGFTSTLLTENFNGVPAGWTTVNNSTLGIPANAAWTLRPNGYNTGGTWGAVLNSNDASQFYLSNSDAQGSGSTTNTLLQSPSFNTVGFTTLNLQFYHYFRFNAAPDIGSVQVSTDGAAWTTVQSYTATTGAPTAFAVANINLNAYVGNPTLYVRYNYSAPWGYGWAVDNVTVSGLGSNYTYSWTSTPAGFTSSSQNPTGVAPAVSTTYDVLITNPFGCSGTGSTNVTVNPLPTVTANSSAATVCENTNITLTGGGATSYAWSGGATDGVAFPATTTTTYTVTGTDGNGCMNTATTMVTVDPAPVVTASSTASAVCAGDMVTLTGGGGVSYAWSGGAMDGVAFAPAATTTYTVTGTDGIGCTNTATVTVTVNALPSVTGMAMPAAVCAGSTTTLMGMGATSYAWSGGVTDMMSFTPASTATYTVTGTDGNGCINTSTTTVTVNALPTVTANTTASTVCMGTMVTLTGSGATSYTWDNGVTDGMAFSAMATTTYMVTGTDVNGCQDMDMITITVNTLPTVTANSTASTVCEGTMVTLTGGGATTYTWDMGVTDGVAFAAMATTTYSVIGMDGNGCADTANTTVTVNMNPVVMLGADITQCGGTTTLDAGNPGMNYMWQDMTTTTQTFLVTTTGMYGVMVTDPVTMCMDMDTIMVTINSNPVVALGADASACASTVLDAGNAGANYLWSDASTSQMLTVTVTGTYNVTVTDPVTMCTGADTIMITINANPVVNIGNDTSMCAGTVIFDAGNVGSNYMWNDATTAQTLTATATGTYYVVVTDPTTMCTGSDTAMVTISGYPVVNLGADVTQCGGTVPLDAGNAGSLFMWNDASTLQTLTASATGMYYVNVTNGVGCSTADTISITINALPTVMYSEVVDTVCMQAAAFTLSAATPAGGIYSGTSVSAGMFNPAIGAGNYTITYMFTDGNGCSNSAMDVINVEDCTGIDENNSSALINVYPNPTSGSFNLMISNANFTEMVISIVDIQGKEVFGSIENNVSKEYNTQINLENLAKGIYYIKLTTNTDLMIQKLIIQ